MSEQAPSNVCRSVNQAGDNCVRKHAHKAIQHSDGKGGYWIGGSKKPAGATFPKPPKKEPLVAEDSIYLSEADYQTWARTGYFF